MGSGQQLDTTQVCIKHESTHQFVAILYLSNDRKLASIYGIMDVKERPGPRSH